MSELFVVLGATGTQGASVIKYVRQQHPSLPIRAITRNTSSPSASALREQGIEVVQADTDDEGSLAAAFKVSSRASLMGLSSKAVLMTTLNKVCNHHLRRHRLLEPLGQLLFHGTCRSLEGSTR
jgi:hypothetical protein